MATAEVEKRAVAARPRLDKARKKLRVAERELRTPDQPCMENRFCRAARQMQLRSSIRTWASPDYRTEEERVVAARAQVHRARARVRAAERRVERAHDRLDVRASAAGGWFDALLVASALGALTVIATAGWARTQPARRTAGPSVADRGPAPVTSAGASGGQLHGSTHRQPQGTEAGLPKLERHMRGLKIALGLTITGWLWYAFTGADPQYAPPFAISVLGCLVVMFFVHRRIKRLTDT